MFKALVIVTATVIFAVAINVEIKYAKPTQIESKLKAVKCFIVAHEIMSLKKCYIKAISRNTSTLNIIANLSRTVTSPIYVNY